MNMSILPVVRDVWYVQFSVGFSKLTVTSYKNQHNKAPIIETSGNLHP